jgi:hypothetical protein
MQVRAESSFGALLRSTCCIVGLKSGGQTLRVYQLEHSHSQHVRVHQLGG